MEATRPPTLAKISTKYGLIDGVLAFLCFLIVTMTIVQGNWLSTSVSVILLVVLMVLAHREFKKTHDGIMTYAQGLGSGTLLSVVGSVVATVLVYVYVAFINPGYPAAALQAQQAVFEQQGITGAQLDQALSVTRAMLSPVGIVVVSLISGIVAGFVIALIVSAFTRANDPKAVY